MRTTPIVPARLGCDGDGVPMAPEFGDVYHPHHGALEQAQHVFLAGNELPARWQGRERFVILETGFGLGNNFLAAWSAWRNDPERCQHLHFISIESRPLLGADLAALGRDPTLASLAAQLVAVWPPQTCNLHRLSFEGGCVQLLLAFGEVATWLPQIDASVDALFLDGFAPAKNPQMWEPRLFKAMARIAAPGATAATWSVARPVRDGLSAAGFVCRRSPGVGGKRDITLAKFAPRFTPRTNPRRRALASAARGDAVVIVGAGLAGCALACALAEQGRSSIVLERAPVIASEGSGNVAGLFHGVVHRDDGRHARFNRAAALEATGQIAAAIAAHGVDGCIEGLLRLEDGTKNAAQMQATLDRLSLPGTYVRAVTAGEASSLAGTAIASAAWFYPGGGWVDPRDLARSYLERAGSRVELRLRSEAAGLRRDVDGRWRVLDASGAEIVSAATVVLANAAGAAALLGADGWPIERQRGQVSAAAAALWPVAALPRLPIAGSGYVLPAIAGRLWFGATSQVRDERSSPSLEDHAANVSRLGTLLAERPDIDPGQLLGRVSFRYAATDRLPLIGPLPLALLGPTLRRSFAAADSTRPEQPRFSPRVPGLFVFTALGSRGIAWSALGAQVLAAMVCEAPVPLEADLLDAIDPARFESRSFRRSANACSAGDQEPEGPIVTGSAGA